MGPAWQDGSDMGRRRPVDAAERTGHAMDLDILDGCSGCDGCSSPGPITAFITGLVSLLWSVVCALMLIARARIDYHLPPPDGQTEPMGSTHWMPEVLACLAGPGLGVLLGLLTMVWATVQMAQRRPRAWAATVIGVTGLIITSLALVTGCAVETPDF